MWLEGITLGSVAQISMNSRRRGGIREKDRGFRLESYNNFLPELETVQVLLKE